MNKYIKKFINMILIIIVLFNNHILVFADKFNLNNNKTFVNIENQNPQNDVNTKVLYVIEKDDYREMLKKNTAIAVNKDSLLPINSENISQEDMNTINSAESIILFGELKENQDEFEKLDNFKDEVFGDNKYENSVETANNFVDRNLLIVNGESSADYLTALQIGNIENRNVLLIDGQVDTKTEEFIKTNGKNKDILFVEGELKISQEIKEQIMTATDNNKYEIDKSQILKANIQPDKSDYISSLYKINKGTANSVNKDIFKKIAEFPSDIIKKSHEDNNELLTDKRKLITYDVSVNNVSENNESILNNQDNKDDMVKDDTANLVNIVESDESLTILKNEEIQDELTEDSYSLTLTYAQPIERYSKVNEGKEEFIPLKTLTEEVVISVMEGDYGNGDERKYNIEQEGYDYIEIQKEIERILLERKIAYEEQLKKEREAMEKSKNMKMQKIPKSAPQANKFIKEALKMKGWIYSQEKRWEYGYADCSSIVVRALINSGITKDKSNLTTWTISSDPRFYEVPMGKIESGDILWYPGHMEIYMGDNSTFGAFRPGKLSGYASNIKRFNRAFRLSGE